MANIAQYRPHNFEVAKQNINYKASQMSSDVQLSSFETSGALFGLLDHKVTGPEINRQLVAPLQGKLRGVTNDIRNLFDIAHYTYNALESLDKDYMCGIVDGVDQAKKASAQAINASAENKQTQEQLNRSFKALVEEFKNNKQQTNAALNSLRSNIDSISAAVGGVQNLKRDMANQQSAFENRMQGVASQNVGYAAPQQPIAAYIIASVALAISVVHLVLNACGVL